MKFGKEFTSQMIPEWEEAYMNYNYLKTILKEIWIFGQRKKSHSSPTNSLPRNETLSNRSSLYRAFSGLTNHHGHYNVKDNDIQVINVSEIEQQEEFQNYQTTFLRSPEEGVENELVFFRCLDNEFNKVNTFFRGKVEEVVMEAQELNKQMDALVALRIKINDPHYHNSSISPNSGNIKLECITNAVFS